MNAYELANELNACFTKADWEYVDDCVNMLRQQADRIKKLENKVKSYENLGNMMLDELLEKAQIKELSDEEIYELWCESDNTELLPEMRNKDGSINYIILTFAELLLKKASEK